MNVAFASPFAQYAGRREEIDAAIRAVLESGRYVLGPEVESFEAEFAAFVGVRHAVGVATGTDAILLALRACNIGAGDEVVTVAHTAGATVAAIVAAGATPVFVDVEPRTLTIDPDAIEAAITPRTRALLPVHIYGHPADLDACVAIAHRRGIRLVEDCAQAHGARRRGVRVGSVGDLGCFSFYPTKNLGAIGDGGMVVTDDADLARKLRLLREYGWSERYVSSVDGLNSRLDELQAAILRVKLRHLDEDNARRTSIAAAYGIGLASPALGLPSPHPDASPVHHLYVVRHPERDGLRRTLAESGVGCAIHYPVPLHRQPAYENRFPCGPLPETEAAAREVLSLPMFPELTDAEVEGVVVAVRRGCAELASGRIHAGSPS